MNLPGELPNSDSQDVNMMCAGNCACVLSFMQEQFLRSCKVHQFGLPLLFEEAVVVEGSSIPQVHEAFGV